MGREATAAFLLSIDDDAYLRSADGIHRALGLVRDDPQIGAVALPQCRPDGSLPEGQSQSAPTDYPCYTPGFAAYAALIRRSAFVELGGYREICWATGEEQEFCKRLLDLGLSVVWLPERCVVHLPNPVGRDERRRLRFGYRNACFDAIMNEPLPRAIASIPARLFNYRRVSKDTSSYYKFDDAGGLLWIISQLRDNFGELLRRRRPLRWTTYRRWEQLKRQYPPYSPRAQAPPHPPSQTAWS